MIGKKEKINSLAEEKAETEGAEEKAEKQIIKGRISDINNIKKSLPQGVDASMVETYLNKDGQWWWHLRPEYIKNKKEREEWKKEEKIWEEY